jgi:hypothetical protein
LPVSDFRRLPSLGEEQSQYVTVDGQWKEQ